MPKDPKKRRRSSTLLSADLATKMFFEAYDKDRTSERTEFLRDLCDDLFNQLSARERDTILDLEKNLKKKYQRKQRSQENKDVDQS